MAKKGNIQVQTTDIFPIIKKWLYSEHDIFLRELVSNACDAITKRSTLARTQNLELPEGKVSVEIDKPKNQIRIHDNGIGMTEQEVEKYIAQLAFSGAEEFVEKMNEVKSADSKDEIIGKFGLGFYSSFMVADKVEVETLSMNEGSTPTKWVCEGDTEYAFEASDKADIGTTITLHINEESKDFLEIYKTRATLTNYCDFMPYPIELIDVATRAQVFEENLKAEKEEDKKPIEIDIINNTAPLWKKDPASVSDEEYKNFYSKMFPMDPEPLFWIHLNIDHPFTLQGILFFPKLNPNKPFNENHIRLYSKQVFVSDNVKDIMPEFLSMLKGSIDSTDIPLNVSRSALQGDPNIKKISNYIVKKVGESLKKLFNNDREKYNKSWEDIGLFIKYGVVSDTKFDDLMRDRVLFKNQNSEFITLEEYKNSVTEEYKEKVGNKVIYGEKEITDTSLIAKLKELNIPTIETDNYIDPHLMQHIEFQKKEGKEYQFTAIDSEFENLFGEAATEAGDIKVKEFFEKILKKEDDKSLEIEVKKLKDLPTPVYFKVDQNMKRFQQMTQGMGQSQFNTPIKKTLVINPENSAVQNAFKLWEGEKKDLAEKIVHHLFDLAHISSDGLEGDARSKFVTRSQDLLKELSEVSL